MKRQKDMKLGDEPPGQYVSSVLLVKNRKIATEGVKRLGQNRNDTQLWVCLVVKVMSDAVKNSMD